MSGQGVGNILICGAPRCGTTALYRLLAGHPQVVASKYKEMNYFLGGGEPWVDSYSLEPRSKESYFDNFDITEGVRYTIEASPAYIHEWCLERVVQRINSLKLPNTKIIFILRDPVARLRSQYLTDITRGNRISESVTFDDYVNACLYSDSNGVFSSIPQAQKPLYCDGVQLGKYGERIDYYYQMFGSKNIHIAFLEELNSNQEKVTKEIADFLGIENEGFERKKNGKENHTIKPKNKILYISMLKVNRALEPILNKFPRIRVFLRNIHHKLNSKEVKEEDSLSEETRQILSDYYQEDFECLSELVRLCNPAASRPDWLKIQ